MIKLFVYVVIVRIHSLFDSDEYEYILFILTLLWYVLKTHGKRVTFTQQSADATNVSSPVLLKQSVS